MIVRTSTDRGVVRIDLGDECSVWFRESDTWDDVAGKMGLLASTARSTALDGESA